MSNDSWAIAMGVVLALSSSCPKPMTDLLDSDPGCELSETRCNGDLVEVCASTSRWSTVRDCVLVSPDADGPPWQCIFDELEGVHTCAPPEIAP